MDKDSLKSINAQLTETARKMQRAVLVQSIVGPAMKVFGVGESCARVRV